MEEARRARAQGLVADELRKLAEEIDKAESAEAQAMESLEPRRQRLLDAAQVHRQAAEVHRRAARLHQLHAEHESEAAGTGQETATE